MKKGLIILLAIIGMGAVCATEPIDDVYYWPAVQTQQEAKVKNPEPQVQSQEQTERLPDATQQTTAPENETKVEFVNVQDTTVTVKIKR